MQIQIFAHNTSTAEFISWLTENQLFNARVDIF